MQNSELGRVRSLQEPIVKRREREGKTFNTTHPLAQAIIKGWETGSKKPSPVDCLVISPEFELMGRQPVNELREDSKNRGLKKDKFYLTFLKEALVGRQPGLGNIILTSERPSHDILDIFRKPIVGYQDYTVVMIDARDFENGGTLIVDFEVGRGEGAGSFCLFDGDTKLSTDEKKPKDTLVKAWGSPSDKKQIIHHFDKGQFFKLGVTGFWHKEKDYVNAFQARITVEENQNENVTK